MGRPLRFQLAVLILTGALGCASDVAAPNPPPPPPPGDSGGAMGDSLSGDSLTGDSAMGGDLAPLGDANPGGDSATGDSFGNLPPTALINGGAAPVVGGDVLMGSIENLVGGGNDPEGGMLTFAWSQTSGDPAPIAGPSSQVASFTASVSAGQDLVFELTVCDVFMACDTNTITFTIVSFFSTDTYVSQNVGDDTPGPTRGQINDPWQSIGAGIAAALPTVSGMTVARVHVAGAAYAEDIVMENGVSILGAYDDAFTTRNVSMNETIIRSSTDTGVLYEASRIYDLPTDLNGVSLESTSMAGTAAIVTIEAGQGLIIMRNAIVRLIDTPAPADASTGIRLVSAATAVNLSLESTAFEGGDVANDTGAVRGVWATVGGSPIAVTGTTVTVNLPMPIKRAHFGFDITGADLDLSDSQITFADAPSPIVTANDEAFGIRSIGGAVTLLRTTIDPGYGFDEMAGVYADGGTLDVTDGTLFGGDAFGPAGGTTTSAAIYAAANVTLNATVGAFTGGNVSVGALPPAHRSWGVFAGPGSTVDIDDVDINAGSGDWTGAVRLVDVAAAIIANSRLNTAPGASASNAPTGSHGIFVEDNGAQSPAVGGLVPVAPGYSCCDPTQFKVIVDNSDVVGGSGSSANGVSMVGSGPSLCIEGSRIDAGDCTPAQDAEAKAGQQIADCVGINMGSNMGNNPPSDGPFLLHNSTVYGGTTEGVSFGVRLTTGEFEPIVANNYIHGGDDPNPGDPNPMPNTNTRTIGLWLVNGRIEAASDGPRIRNNIIHSGSGDKAFVAMEENHNADPWVFSYNNLVVDAVGGWQATASSIPGVPTAGSLLYRNCTRPSCGGKEYGPTEIALVNSELDDLSLDESAMGALDGQTTLESVLNIADAMCLVDPTPRGGNVAQAPGSNCINAGLEAFETDDCTAWGTVSMYSTCQTGPSPACRICDTPWIDMLGGHRLTMEVYDTGGTCSSMMVEMAMTGDGSTDIGPIED